jgi:5-enolpyruvylshikimate-3-phosphate synthase
MAFGILSAVGGNRITVKDAESVAVSYPRFWDDLTMAVA